jgi:hypothetical protein
VTALGHGWLFVAGAMGATAVAMLLTGPAPQLRAVPQARAEQPA